MNALVFVDTNVVIYSRDAREPEKQARAHEWLAYLWEEDIGRLSAQVLHEYYYAVTRKVRPGLTAGEARDDVRALMQWITTVQPGVLLDAAWGLQDSFSLSFWDALIVAAARAADCRYLLTEDLKTGQNYDGVLVINPFRTSPADITKLPRVS